MSELITGEIFSDGQQNINAANMNGIVGKASVQPDIIAAKPASAAMDVADQMLILKTDNTLARARFDTIVNSTSSTLPLADTTKNGMLRQTSGKTTDVVDGTNNCVPISNFLPPGVVVDFAGGVAPAGWLLCNGQSVSRTTYSALYAILGTSYGSIDGNSFNVPNCTGRVTAGVGGTLGGLGTLGGAASVALATGHLPSHTHTMGNHSHLGADHTHSMMNHGHTYTNFTGVAAGTGLNMGTGGGLWMNGVSAGTSGPNTANTSASQQGLTTGGPSTNSTDATGSGVAFAILPPYIALNKIIKT